MKYITVYTTKDNSEISVLESLFEDENIDYKILTDENTRNGKDGLSGKRFQVIEEDRDKARELLERGGFARMEHLHNIKTSSRLPAKRWIFVVLAALILIVVAILLTWFMNAE